MSLDQSRTLTDRVGASITAFPLGAKFSDQKRGSQLLEPSKAALGDATLENAVQMTLFVVARNRFIELHLGPAAIDAKGRDLVVEVGAPGQAPAHSRVGSPGRTRQRPHRGGEG